MDEKELNGFSWTILFFVTGASFLCFTGVIWLLDGAYLHLFLKIGLVSLLLATLSVVNKWLSAKQLSRNAHGN